MKLTDLRSGFEGKLWPQLLAVSAALPTFRPNGSITLVTAIDAITAIAFLIGITFMTGLAQLHSPAPHAARRRGCRPRTSGT